MTTVFKQWLLFTAWLIALCGFLITVYMSAILNIEPCHLCWYQRICMYPLVIILGIATFRNDHHIGIYTLPLIVIGGLFALYQYLLQMVPGFSPIELCGAGPDCSQVHFTFLGFITFPFLTLIACVALFILLLKAMRSSR